MADGNDDDGHRPRGSGGFGPRRRPGSGARTGWTKQDFPRSSGDNWRNAGRRPRVKSERGEQAAANRSAFEGERIAKVIARAGLCSRRDAEAWIGQGRVTLNGQVLKSPAVNVAKGDAIAVDGKPLAQRERTRLWLFHKPRGAITTESDPEGRRTIFEALPEGLPRVVTIGRLDFNTEGLLLLTNDGGLARTLELPATAWLRRYRVRANGEVDQAALERLAKGVTIDGVDYAGIEAALDREQGANVWLTLGLREGKNREVKRVLEHLGLVVNRLIRLSFGPFQLGDLAVGHVMEIKTRVLRDQLGETIARQAGADFDAPVRDEANLGPEPPARKREPFRDVAPAFEPERSEPIARKHVSAMRAERAHEQRFGPRKRIERDSTSDSRGRLVPVERIKPASGKLDRTSRNGRRFAGGHGRQEEGQDHVWRRRERSEGEARRDRPEERDWRDNRGGANRSERPDRRERREGSFSREAGPARDRDVRSGKPRPERAREDCAPNADERGDRGKSGSRKSRGERSFSREESGVGRHRSEHARHPRERYKTGEKGRDRGPRGPAPGGPSGGKRGVRPAGKPDGRPGRPPRGR